VNRKPNPDQNGHHPQFVRAPVIASRLSVTSRYVLQLADQGRIPCIRLGRKCVRFDPAAVAAALGINWNDVP
jgi:excisionase family DNA binding protein